MSNKNTVNQELGGMLGALAGVLLWGIPFFSAKARQKRLEEPSLEYVGGLALSATGGAVIGGAIGGMFDKEQSATPIVPIESPIVNTNTEGQ